MSHGLKVRDFKTKEQVRSRLAEKISDELEFIEDVGFGEPEVFQPEEVNRIPVNVEVEDSSFESWDLYIPEESLEFWNGSNYSVPNFDRIVKHLCEAILYYKTNGTTENREEFYNDFDN